MQINPVPAVTSQSDLLADINNVKKRIKEIEDQFNIKQFSPESVTFSQVLNKQINNTGKINASAAYRKQAANVAQNTAPTNNSAGTTARMHNLPPQQIEEIIQKTAAKYGIDPKLLSAVAETESNYRPDAVSSAGAIGVMQLMPDTASALGVSDPYDAQQNIEGGAKYLKELLNDFGGDVREAVAAYNAGPQAVKKYQGVPPYAETQNYVSHVLDLYQ